MSLSAEELREEVRRRYADSALGGQRAWRGLWLWRWLVLWWMTARSENRLARRCMRSRRGVSCRGASGACVAWLWQPDGGGGTP